MMKKSLTDLKDAQSPSSGPTIFISMWPLMLPAPWEGGAELILHKEQLQMPRQQAAWQPRPDTDREMPQWEWHLVYVWYPDFVTPREIEHGQREKGPYNMENESYKQRWKECG